VADSARVVVIGGGITGVSVAYHLAEAGWTDVLLVEKAGLTAGATSQAAGLVTAFNPSSTMLAWPRYSIELYRRPGVIPAGHQALGGRECPRWNQTAAVDDGLTRRGSPPSSDKEVTFPMIPESIQHYLRRNRVRFERCTDGASDAIEQAPVFNGVPPELADEYPDLPPMTANSTVPVWHRGYATWVAAFHHMTTPEGRDRDGDGVPEIPSLADARLVILSASSDASSWLTYSADAFAEELRAIAGPDVEVRIMIDGLFGPSLDNEARYHPEVPPGFNMLADPYSQTGLCQLPDNEDGIANEACSGAATGPGHACATPMRTATCASTNRARRCTAPPRRSASTATTRCSITSRRRSWCCPTRRTTPSTASPSPRAGLE